MRLSDRFCEGMRTVSMLELADYGNLLRIYLRSVLSPIFPDGTFLYWLANMLNLGISSVLWALLSTKTPYGETSPVRAGHASMANKRSTEFAGQQSLPVNTFA